MMVQDEIAYLMPDIVKEVSIQLQNEKLLKSNLNFN